MENYEQKYKEALSRARIVNPGTKDYNIVTAIFPELKESEDERIRKEIIHYLDREITLSNFGGDIATFKRWIAWLEKQGEHKNFAPKSATEAIKEEKINNANKVEPKFKVGDWIVGNYVHTISKVVNIKHLSDGTYGYDLDNSCGCYFASFEEGYHLWSIKDAEKGDILQANKCTLIFDSLTKDIDGNTVISSWYYCNTKTFYGIGTCKPDLWAIEGVTPATEEQCDFLFAKMKEAGYKWDVKEKKLTKL